MHKLLKAQTNSIQGGPTKTRLKKEQERKARADALKSKIEITPEQVQYILTLEDIKKFLPKEPPKDWTEKNFRLALGYVEVILKRLEAFTTSGAPE